MNRNLKKALGSRGHSNIRGRSGWTTIVIAVQLFYSLLLGSLSLYFLELAHQWEVRFRGGPKLDAEAGMIVASAVLGLSALMAFSGYLGLWKEKTMGMVAGVAW